MCKGRSEKTQVGKKELSLLTECLRIVRMPGGFRLQAQFEIQHITMIFEARPVIC